MTVKEYNNAVRELGDHVYRFIFHSIKDSHRADDIVQDTYEKLWRCVTEIEYGAVKSWLFSTAYNRMIDVIRKDSRLVGVEYYDDRSLYAEESSSDLNEVLHRALDTLPTAQRSVILLRDYEGYSYKEIADITALSEAQVKTYIFRGRVALRNYLVKASVWQ
ncbi:MAG: RNA polymerase sigma factor [Bacteroidales bacterium]|jgi:RNA polymerase sigma-70 factor (ECF subfamily)|nr:RNA polymerase sigma factor [Bacteroidales bacterium]